MSDVKPATDEEIKLFRSMAAAAGSDLGLSVLARLDAANARIAELEENLSGYRENEEQLERWAEEAYARAETAERKLAAAREALTVLLDVDAHMVGDPEHDSEVWAAADTQARAALALIDKTETSDD